MRKRSFNVVVSACAFLAWGLNMTMPCTTYAQESLEPIAASNGFSTIFTAERSEPDRMVDGLAVTYHTLSLDDGEIDYAAACGQLSVAGKLNRGSTEVFFTAYSRRLQDNTIAGRPLVFAFNGGPGASSVWLHFALGPKRVAFPDSGEAARPPYQLVDNPDTVLRFADIVFVDAVGTGYSQPNSTAGAKQFFGMQQDVDWSARFIEQYVSRFNLWSCPKYLVGESYGGMRAVWLASQLQMEHGLDLQGIALLSTPIDLKMLFNLPGYDLPYVLRLPSFAAIAMHHGRLAETLTEDPAATLQKVEQWATTDYVLALTQGDRLKPEARRATAEQLARFTGLSVELILEHDLRISDRTFTHNLLRDTGLSTGWMDGRFTSPGHYEFPAEDPSMIAATGPYVETWNSYVRSTLCYSSPQAYRFHEIDVCLVWDWGPLDQGPITMYDSLRKALGRNPHLRVMVASGRHDLNTPYFATRYGIEHARLGKSVAKRIQYHEYDGGHQVYMSQNSLERLSADLKAFIRPPSSASRD